jgi:ATP-dependent DNA helicase RecQ
MDMKEVVNSLKALKQEQVISYLEQVYMPSRVQFISGKEGIEEFEYRYPELEPIIKGLLRTYSGVFDHSVRIRESNLAWILKRDLQTIYEQLALLNNANIILYSPKKELPQLCYLQDRIRAEDLNINYETYLQRKQEYVERIEKMIGYVNTTSCRSVYIGQYFGDEAITRCGVCDRCRDNKQKKMGIDEFQVIATNVLDLLKISSMTMYELLNKAEVEETALKEVITTLKRENLIKIVQDGRIERV